MGLQQSLLVNFVHTDVIKNPSESQCQAATNNSLLLLHLRFGRAQLRFYHCMAYRRRIGRRSDRFPHSGSKITGDCSHEIRLLLGRKGMTNLDIVLKSKNITLPTMVRIVKISFSSSHVRMSELDHKEG